MVDPAVWLSIVAAKSVNKKKAGLTNHSGLGLRKNRLSIGYKECYLLSSYLLESHNILNILAILLSVSLCTYFSLQ